MHEGGCSCGAVRYRLAGPPMFEAYDDIAALWPAESLRRREALLDKRK